MTDMDERIAAAQARLDAREDPPPPPTLPPVETKVVFDRRLVVEEIAETIDGKVRTGRRWHVYDGTGAELPPDQMLNLYLCAADMITCSKGWPQPLYLAARETMRALALMQRVSAGTRVQ